MALVLKDRIKETSSTTGTGTLTLGGAVDGFRSFADIGDGNTTYYCIADGNNFEVGIGTYTASGTTLARTTVLQTSAGNTNKITCTGNQKVFVTQPASKAAYLDASNELVVASTALSSIQQRWTKTATSNQTVFSGAADNSGPTLAVNSSSHVFLNGIFLKETTDYALSGGTTVTLTAGATVNDIVEVITFTPLSSSITGISDGDIPVFTSGVADNDFLKVAGTSIEGRSASEVLSDIGGQSALTFGISSGNVPTFTSGVADNDFLKIDGTTVEGRSAAEVRSDLNVEDGATANSAGNAITISSGVINHSDTSSQASSNNSGRTYIQDITLDTYGHVTGLATATETVTDTNTTYSAGSGIDLNGTTFSHTDTSSQSSSNNSGRTYIQDITLDTYGHVTGIATATETVTDTNTTYSGGTNISLSGTTFNLDNSITLSGTAQATRYYIDGTSKYIDSVGGNYGTIKVEGGSGGWLGYAISDNWVFMSSSTTYCGIYNDIDNEWLALFYRNDRVELRYNNVESFRTRTGGIRVRSTSNGADGYVFLGDNEHSYIYNDEGSHVKITTGSAENFIYANENSHTYLYYDGSWRLRTNISGISVINSTSSDGTIYFGDNAHSKIHNDEGTAVYIDTGANEKTFYGQENSYTYLYYNGAWKARTHNEGFEVSGSIIVSDKVSVNNSYGTSGQVLTSNGGSSAASWQDAGGGGWEFVSGVRARQGSEGSITTATFNNIERNAMYMMLIWDWYLDVNNTSQYNSQWVPTLQVYFDVGYGWNKNANNGTLGWYQSSRNRSYNSTTNSNSGSFNQAGAYLNASYTPTRNNTVPPLMYVVYFNNTYGSDTSNSFKYEWRYQYFGNNGYRSQDGFGTTYNGVATSYDTHAQSVRLTTKNGSTNWHGQVALYKARIS
tara:strand:+ start:1161 stop:3866 length:2706 start_codon:yes stop_codon:yes gene_type:complete